MKALSLLVLGTLYLAVTAEVRTFDDTTAQAIFGSGQKTALFLFTDDSDQSIDAQSAFEEFGINSAPEGVILTHTAQNDGLGHFDRLAQYLGVNVNNAPVAMFVHEKGGKYLLEDDFSAEAFENFVNSVQSGSATPFFKSAEPPADNSAPVKIIVGSQFEEMVLNSEKQVLVKFYAPWCGHCKTIAPHWDEAAQRIAQNPNIMIAKVDSTVNEVPSVNIKGYPTLLFWGKDKTKEPITFNGDRSAQGIIDWLKDHTQYEWVQQKAPEIQEPSSDPPSVFHEEL